MEYGCDKEPAFSKDWHDYHSESAINCNHESIDPEIPAEWAAILRQHPSIRLVRADDSRFAGFFPFKLFNPMQSICFQITYESDSNLVISAPTASGKTVIFELSILKFYNISSTSTARKVRGKIVVYMSPLRSLCQERYKNWKSRMGRAGISCLLVIGDVEVKFKELSQAQVIITTPEKFDALTRQKFELLQLTELLLVDEIHILGDKRGASLEGLITRFMMIDRPIRIVALSASIQNAQDIATWLNARFLSFDHSYRPVPLQAHVFGFPCKSHHGGREDYFFDKSLNSELTSLILEFGNHQPTLIFCNTRNGCYDSAEVVAESLMSYLIRDESHHRVLKAAAQHIVDNKRLRFLIERGIGVHSAGLAYNERALVERLFAAGDLHVLCSTTTLSMGVNLPAHCVIVKNTSLYETGIGWIEADPSTILQCLGRAGRPGFDTQGVGLILCKESHFDYYMKLTSDTLRVESSLLPSIAEQLVATIVVNKLTSVEQVYQWLSRSYLIKRMHSNPGYYGLPVTINVDAWCHDFIVGELNKLVQSQLLMPRASAAESAELRLFEHTYLAAVLSRYQLDLKTIQSFACVPSNAHLADILYVIAGASEFERFRYKAGDKAVLNGFNKNSFKLKKLKTCGSREASIKRKRNKTEKERWPRIPMPIQTSRVSTLSHKIFLMLQIEMAGYRDNLGQWGLKTELDAVFDVARRVSSGLQDYLINRQHSFLAMKNAIIANKSILRKAFKGFPTSLMQFNCMRLEDAQLLNEAGVLSLGDLIKIPATRINAICNKAPGHHFGNDVVQSLLTVPQFDIHAKMTEDKQGIVCTMQVIQTRSDYVSTSRSHNSSSNGMLHNVGEVCLLVGTIDRNSALFLHRRLLLISRKYEYQVVAHIPHGVDQFQIAIVHMGIVDGEWIMNVVRDSSCAEVPIPEPEPLVLTSAREATSTEHESETNSNLIEKIDLTSENINFSGYEGDELRNVDEHLNGSLQFIEFQKHSNFKKLEKHAVGADMLTSSKMATNELPPATKKFAAVKDDSGNQEIDVWQLGWN